MPIFIAVNTGSEIMYLYSEFWLYIEPHLKLLWVFFFAFYNQLLNFYQKKKKKASWILMGIAINLQSILGELLSW